MSEPTREECERVFPQLRVDAHWQLLPVVNSAQRRIGFAAIYEVGARTFVTPVFDSSCEVLPRAAGGER